MTARARIIARLFCATRPLMVHEIKALRVSDTACSARLREMAREGIVVSTPVKGTKMTAWSLVPQELVLNLTGVMPQRLGGRTVNPSNHQLSSTLSTPTNLDGISTKRQPEGNGAVRGVSIPPYPSSETRGAGPTATSGDGGSAALKLS